MRWEPFKFWNLVHLILEVWQYAHVKHGLANPRTSEGSVNYLYSYTQRKFMVINCSTLVWQQSIYIQGWRLLCELYILLSKCNSFTLKKHGCNFKCVVLIINSLAPGKFEWNFRHVIFRQILVIDGGGISCEIALIWMSLEFTDDQSTLDQVMAWCHQATSHYLSQCWPRSLSPYGAARPQSISWTFPVKLNYKCHKTLLIISQYWFR